MKKISKKRKEEIINKIDWEGGYEEYFINYGTDEKDMKDPVYGPLVISFKEAYADLKAYLEA